MKYSSIFYGTSFTIDECGAGPDMPILKKKLFFSKITDRFILKNQMMNTWKSNEINWQKDIIFQNERTIAESAGMTH